MLIGSGSGVGLVRVEAGGVGSGRDVELSVELGVVWVWSVCGRGV